VCAIGGSFLLRKRKAASHFFNLVRNFRRSEIIAGEASAVFASRKTLNFGHACETRSRYSLTGYRVSNSFGCRKFVLQF